MQGTESHKDKTCCRGWYHLLISVSRAVMLVYHLSLIYSHTLHVLKARGVTHVSEGCKISPRSHILDSCFPRAESSEQCFFFLACIFKFSTKQVSWVAQYEGK